MSAVSEITLLYLPGKRKTSPKGWLSFNAVCCHHNGQSIDTRGRGGFIANGDGGASYHCFNCGYKASWQPGRQLSPKYKKLLRWMHVPDGDINKLALQILRENEGVVSKEHVSSMPKFEPGKLIAGALSIADNAEATKNFLAIIEYMQSRELYLEDYPFYWTKTLGYRDRLIIPFYYEGVLVGYTARSVDSDKRPKYLAEEPSDYVFNLDAQSYDKETVLVFEGPIDAIYMGGTALLGSAISTGQELLLNRLNKEVIVVPDRDTSGKKLVEDALSRGWSLSMPEWEDDIKDVGDAVMRYGRLYTLHSIFRAAEHSPLKNRLRAKKWFLSKEV
jgi:hypothetical protein